MAETKLGVSGTDLNQLSGGALDGLFSQDIANQAMSIANQLYPQLPEPDPWEAAFQFFAEMGRQASQPGATVLGSAVGSMQAPLDYLNAKKKEKAESDRARMQSTISLGTALKGKDPSLSTIAKLNADFKAGRITKEQFDAAFAKATNISDSKSGALSPLGKLASDLKNGVINEEQFDAGFAKATNISDSESGALSPLGKLAEDFKNGVITEEEYNAGVKKATYIANQSDNKLSTFGILDSESQPLGENVLAIETLLNRKVNVDDDGNALLSGQEVETVNNAGLLVPKKSTQRKITTKTISKGTLVEYMSAEDAKSFLIDQGLSEENSNFNRIVEELTAVNEDQIGKPIIKNGIFMELYPVYQDENLINFQLSSSDSSIVPYFTTYTQKRLPLLAKSSDTYNVQAREVLPRVDEALALLKTGEVTTGLLSEKMLPFKQIFSQAFGINDPEINNMLTLQATSNFMAPKMRPVGSGSTSDMEFRAYQKAALFIGNTPEANYISLYAFKKMAENAIELNRKEIELLTSNQYSDLTQINNQLKSGDSGIFEKYTGSTEGPDAEAEFQQWYDSLEDGAVIINNGLFNVSDSYVIKGWGS
jgi:hypothetical protein